MPPKLWEGPGEAGMFRADSRAERKPRRLERRGFRRVPRPPSLFPDGRQRRGRSISSAAIATSVTGCCSGGERVFLTSSGGSLETETFGWSQVRSIVLRKTHTAMQQHNAANNKNRNIMFPPFC
ncbi:hypothetical protein [Vibrio zhanjiangensis]|uniref:hypothetical protein n=1 Tax=Vibrio zhanjiangensis TaxID=1046128 RepID=UPI0024E10A88|nr:hypothetical protein [Vibrio zhanjiangensis]